jgi:PKD repeat protein
MLDARDLHTATLLPNGKVLVAGGGAADFGMTASAELYDPSTGVWSATGDMPTPHFGHTATLLDTGLVLVASGGASANDTSPQFACALYDPAASTWSPTAAMKGGQQRSRATDALLPDGRVLLVGGVKGSTNLDTLNSAVLYALGEPPVAVATADVTSGSAPLTVHFDGSASSDPNPGDTLSYAWDFESDGVTDSTEVSPIFVYAAPGGYVANLRVTDPGGGEGIAVVTVQVGGSPPPSATIAMPTAGTTWAVGDAIVLSGSGSSTQHGALPASAMSWSVAVLNCWGGCQATSVQTFPGVASGSFTVPDQPYPSLIQVMLTVTDPEGKTGVASLDLQPKTVTLGFDTVPTGLEVDVGASTSPSPFDRTVVVGAVDNISVASPQLSGGTSFVFTGWSDGLAQAHDITAPAQPTTYVATFDADSEGDGIGNSSDVCPSDEDPQQADMDGDGVGDACDNCPGDENAGQ